MTETQTTIQKTILLTGFGPFPRVPENASSTLVPLIADAARAALPGHKIIAAVLPTEWTLANQNLDELLATHVPDICLHFGVSERATGFVIETLAHNACETAPDNAGCLPGTTHLDTGGPNTRASSFPADAIVAKLRSCDLPAQHSTDPGRYLCNAVLYRSLAFDDALTHPACTGFVHIPTAFSSASDPQAWTLDRAVSGGLTIVETCLNNQPAKTGSVG